MRRKPLPRILAIDPGIRHVGIAVLQGSGLVYHGVLTMPYRRAPEAIRRNTKSLIRFLIDDFGPRLIALEGNSIGRNGTRAPLHEVVSQIKRSCRHAKIPVVVKAASTVKKVITGSGRASKEEVARACARYYPELKAYLRQTAKWRTQYHGNMFDAVALGLAACPEKDKRIALGHRRRVVGRMQNELFTQDSGR